jgi:hypothetical protein
LEHVPTGTVDFITTTEFGLAYVETSLATEKIVARSAAPLGSWGVATQRNRNSDSATWNDSTSEVKVKDPAAKQI